jgi:hypothetical protein
MEDEPRSNRLAADRMVGLKAVDDRGNAERHIGPRLSIFGDDSRPDRYLNDRPA